MVFRADTVGFVPVDFRMRYRTIAKFNGCNSFKFPPVSFAVQLPQALAFSNGGTGGDDFDIDNAADDPEFHALLIVLEFLPVVLLNCPSYLFGHIETANPRKLADLSSIGRGAELV